MMQIIKILSLVAVIALSACVQQERQPRYEIDGTTGDVTDATAYLYKYLPEYDKQTLADSVKVSKGKFYFSGSTDEPVEAYLRFTGDSTAYCFILTNNRITFVRTDSVYCINGTESNRKLTALLLEKHKFENRRQSLQAIYGKMSADSTLTKIKEDSLAAAYRAIRINFGKTLAAEIAGMSADCPLAARTSLRLYHNYMQQADVDSLNALVKPGR